MRPYAVETSPNVYAEASPNAVEQRADAASGGKRYTYPFLCKQTDAFLAGLGILRLINPSPPAPSKTLTEVAMLGITRVDDAGQVQWQESDMSLESARTHVLTRVRNRADRERNRPIVVAGHEFNRGATEEQVKMLGAALGAGNMYSESPIRFDAIRQIDQERVRLPVDEAQFEVLSRQYALDILRVNNRESTLLDAAENAADVDALRLALADLDTGW